MAEELPAVEVVAYTQELPSQNLGAAVQFGVGKGVSLDTWHLSDPSTGDTVDLTPEEYEAWRASHPEFYKLPHYPLQATAPQTPNTIGRLQGPVAKSAAPAAQANPSVKAETPEEKGWWAKAGGWVHGGLDVLGAIPEVGAVFDGANALIYTAEGNYAQAAISGGAAALDLVPVVGDVGKATEFGVKGAAKVAEHATEEAAAKKLAEEAAAKKLEEEAAEQAAKKKAEEEEAKKLEEEEARKAEEEAAKKKKEGEGGKSEAGPCDHLKQGSGKGPYRGGAHKKTKGPVGDGKDSHHMPADDVSPLKRDDGPAIHMDPDDHAMTSSNGQNGAAGKAYRAEIGDLLKQGKWREAMLKEIQDVRRLAAEIGDPRKYNEAMLEMLEYFKCLEKHNILPMS